MNSERIFSTHNSSDFDLLICCCCCCCSIWSNRNCVVCCIRSSAFNMHTDHEIVQTFYVHDRHWGGTIELFWIACACFHTSRTQFRLHYIHKRYFIPTSARDFLFSPGGFSFVFPIVRCTIIVFFLLIFARVLSGWRNLNYAWNETIHR